MNCTAWAGNGAVRLRLSAPYSFGRGVGAVTLGAHEMECITGLPDAVPASNAGASRDY